MVFEHCYVKRGTKESKRFQNISRWIHSLKQPSWYTEPQAAVPRETLKYHLTALTCHSCAHTTNSHRLVDSGALIQA